MAEGVEFLILGPLEVRIGGRPTDLGRARAGRLLVALLLNAGQFVSIDRLVAELWGDGEPPPSARGQLHVLVSQLRRSLGGHAVIETSSGGYRIDSRAVRIDAEEAERLIGQGRAHDDPACYRQALALWRGPVLDGMDGHEVLRLEELRLTAAQEWARLEPDPALVVEGLEPLLAANPHHEALRARLAVALDRLDRRQEATGVLREGRRLLDDQLGLEPGAELQRAERLIDGTLTGHPVPAQLPRPLATFTGRSAEVRQITELLATGAVALYGPAGIGKSALAIQVAHQVAGRYPDGQLYVNLQGSTPDAEPLPVAEVLGRFLRSVGVAASSISADEEEAAATFRSLTAGRRLMIVLDNAANPAQIRRLLPGSPSCAVIITSRRMLSSIDTARHHRLDVLGQGDAGALLARLVGAERLEREAPAVAEVMRVCGMLPLALAIVAARLVARPDLPVEALAGRLAVEQRRLAELAVDDQAVRASFMVSYQDLCDEPAARLYRLLGLLEGPDVGLPVAAALADLPERRAAALLDQLVDNQLAECDTPGRYRMHDLLRLFARERALTEEGEHDRTQAVRRALHCYVATARRAAVLVEPTIHWRIDCVPEELAHPGLALGSVEEVHTWMEAEIDNLLAAAHQAVDPAIAVYLNACLNTPLEQRARFREQLSLARLAGEAAHLTGDIRQEGLAHNDLGWALHSLGRSQEALSRFDQALALWRPNVHDSGFALALHGRGACLRAAGRHDESLAALREAADLWHELGHYRHESSCLTGMGLTYIRLGRHAEAVACHESALTLSRSSGARVTEVMVLGNLGEAHRLAGEFALAAASFREALELDRERGLGGTYWEAEHLWGLGRTLNERAHLVSSAGILRDLGLITYEEALEIELSPDPPTPDAIAQQL